MLHLPLPHICPACNGLHEEVAAERRALSASGLRPYFATYTPSKFPAGSGQTPLVFVGSIGTAVTNNFPTLNFLNIAGGAGGAGNGGPVRASGLGLLTEFQGYIIVSATGTTQTNSGGGHLDLYLTVGGTVVSEVTGASAAGGAQCGLVIAGVFAAGTAMTLQGTSTLNATVSWVSSEIRVTFVPTPTYPR